MRPNEILMFFSCTRLGLRSPIVERNNIRARNWSLLEYTSVKLIVF